jgi:hypothetical protein
MAAMASGFGRWSRGRGCGRDLAGAGESYDRDPQGDPCDDRDHGRDDDGDHAHDRDHHSGGTSY